MIIILLLLIPFKDVMDLTTINSMEIQKLEMVPYKLLHLWMLPRVGFLMLSFLIVIIVLEITM